MPLADRNGHVHARVCQLPHSARRDERQRRCAADGEGHQGSRGISVRFRSLLFRQWLGVAISLASPAADPLARAGFDGAIDTHFWDRFGGALLLSIVDDGVFAIAGNGNQYQTARVPSDAAAIALQGSIDMPPTLRKPQGSEVSIFVAQDFDFSSVYDLKAR